MRVAILVAHFIHRSTRRPDMGHRIKSAQSAREPTVFAAAVRRGVTVSRPINPATPGQPRDQAFALWQGVPRGISVGRHVVRRWNPCPDPDRQVADNEQRCRGLKPWAGRSRLTAERGSNSLSRIQNRRLGMRSCCQQYCEDADDDRACRNHGWRLSPSPSQLFLVARTLA